jgi:ATP-binding cassette, subfamily B, bacterial
MRGDARSAWLAYLRRYRGFRRTVALSVVLLTAQSMLYASLAFFVKWIFDDILMHRPFVTLAAPGGAILAVVALSGLLSRIARQRILRATKLVVGTLRRELLAKAYDLANDFAAAPDATRLHSLIVLDTERVDVMSNAAVTIALPALLTGSVLCVAMLLLAPELLLVALCVGSLSLAVNRYLGTGLRKWTEHFNAAFESFSQGILAALRRMQLTRALGAAPVEIAHRVRQIDTLRTVSAGMAMSATTYNIAQTYVTALVTLSILLVGGGAVMSGRLSLSVLAAAYVIVSQLGATLGNLWNAVPPIVAGHRSLIDIGDLLSRPGAGPRDGTVERTLTGAVQLDRCRFAYGDRPVLTDVSLEVAAGECVVIMGANGAGKSTLALLLLGFYTCQSGRILVDGTPLNTLSPNHFRRQIGVVLHEQYLFAGTVAENITYGRENAAQSEIEAASTWTGAHTFIRALPEGYDTVIGAEGAILSGGQSQLIALTRALLGCPKLLILDEPTNHLDRETATSLCTTLQGLPFRPTILLITHDPQIAGAFKRVCWLQDGTLTGGASSATALRGTAAAVPTA